MEDGAELMVVDRRNDGSKGSAEAKCDGVSESDAEVADREAEGEASDSPEDSPEDGEVDAARVLCVGGAEDSGDVGNENVGKDERRDDPSGESLDEPVDLPRPALDSAEGDEVCGGSEAADPVIDDADKRIGSHAVPLG